MTKHIHRYIPMDDVLIADLAEGRKRTVKLTAIWDYKYPYIGGPSLHCRSSGYVRIAMPKLMAMHHESDEFKEALAIVKEVDKYLKWKEEWQ